MLDKVNILLIEDNPNDAQLVKIYLREMGVKGALHHAITHQAGMEIAETDKNIDIALIDLTLPDLQGFKTFTSFKEVHPNIPIIVFTGRQDESLGSQSVKLGAQDYLMKDKLNADILVRSIRYAIQRHSTQYKIEENTKSLSISEHRLKEILDIAALGSWEIDLVTNTMRWSEIVYQILDLPVGGITPTFSQYLSYVHPLDVNNLETVINQANRDGQIHRLGYRIVSANRKVKHVDSCIKVYHNTIDDKLYTISTIQEHASTEDASSASNEHSNDMLELPIERMAFQVRTPLTSAVNLLYLLGNSPLNAEQKDYYENLKTSLDDLSMSLNNLLNYAIFQSKTIVLDERPFKIKEFIENLLRVCQIKSEAKRISIFSEVSSSLQPLFIGDTNKINQILYNILDNAIKHTSERGTIHFNVKASGRKDDKYIIHFEIKDNGKGIGNEALYQILHKELNMKNPKGLTIVRKLLNSMDGEVKMTSQREKGTTVDIFIPMKVQNVNIESDTTAPTRPTSILLVEDHFLNQIATKRILTAWSDNITVHIAENGKIALEKFNTHKYNIVLMDLQMPVMDGFEASKIIRQTSNVPIIALSANSSSQELEKSYKVGVNDYLAKPFKPTELYAKIKNHI